MAGKGDKGRVLLAWELGEGFGHARRLLDMANLLAEDGWQPVIASRIIRTMSKEYREAGYPVLQSPSHTGLTLTKDPFSANTYADIMAICGFADSEALYAPVAAWDQIIDMVRPTFVIGDYAPILSLACFGRVPLLVFGDGFVVPPAMGPGFPPTGSTRPPVITLEQLMDQVRQVQAWRGAPMPDGLSQIVCGDGQIICAYPELDVYKAHRDAPATGPILPPPRVLPPCAETRIFVYLSATFRLTRAMLQSVVNSRLPAEGYVRDMDKDPKLADDLRRSGFILHDQPPPLPEVMKRCSVLIHHGGAGTLETAALLGRVQLLVPRHLEQTMNARTVGTLGAALRMAGNFEVKDGVAAVGAAASEQNLVDGARDLAGKLASFTCSSREKLLMLSQQFT